MTFSWERLIWCRSSRLQIDLPTHGPSLVTLIKLIAKNRVFIVDLDVEKQAATIALEPDVLTHRPTVISITLRTKSKRQEEQVLRTLSGLGYRYQVVEIVCGR